MYFFLVGEFLGMMEDFQEKLVKNIISTYKKLKHSENTVFHQYILLLLNPSAQTEFHDFVTSIQKGKKHWKLSIANSLFTDPMNYNVNFLVYEL